MSDLLTGTAKIKVIGVGGGGCNAVNRMVKAEIKSAEFVAVNTDKQALMTSLAPTKVQIGEKLTSGLGAGADPNVGAKAAEESRDEIRKQLQDVDLLFVTAGMGGGTGTGAAPIIASISKEMGILTVAVVTTPFNFEGKRRMSNALQGLERLREHVDTLLVIPNQKLTEILPKGTTIVKAFLEADEVLRKAVQSISDLIVTPSLINLDFADVRTVMADKGMAHMGIGEASGPDKATKAMRLAVASPLLETNIDGAKNVIINIIGGKDMSLDEVDFACNLVRNVADPKANIIFGAGLDESFTNKVQVTIIATGFNGDTYVQRPTKNMYDINDTSIVDNMPQHNTGRSYDEVMSRLTDFEREHRENNEPYGGEREAERTVPRQQTSAPRYNEPDFSGYNPVNRPSEGFQGGNNVKPAYNAGNYSQPQYNQPQQGGYNNQYRQDSGYNAGGARPNYSQPQYNQPYPPNGFAQQGGYNTQGQDNSRPADKKPMPGFLERLRRMRNEDSDSNR